MKLPGPFPATSTNAASQVAPRSGGTKAISDFTDLLQKTAPSKKPASLAVHSAVSTSEGNSSAPRSRKSSARDNESSTASPASAPSQTQALPVLSTTTQPAMSLLEHLDSASATGPTDPDTGVSPLSQTGISGSSGTAAGMGDRGQTQISAASPGQVNEDGDDAGSASPRTPLPQSPDASTGLPDDTALLPLDAAAGSAAKVSTAKGEIATTSSEPHAKVAKGPLTATTAAPPVSSAGGADRPFLNAQTKATSAASAAQVRAVSGNRTNGGSAVQNESAGSRRSPKGRISVAGSPVTASSGESLNLLAKTGGVSAEDGSDPAQRSGAGAGTADFGGRPAASTQPLGDLAPIANLQSSVSVASSQIPHLGGAPVGGSQGQTGVVGGENLKLSSSTPNPGYSPEMLAGSTLSSARLMQSLSQSEMRLSLHSADFGQIAIHTSLTRNVISAQISLESSRLGDALSSHLSSIQQRLGEEYGLKANVVLGGAGAGLSSGSDRDPGGSAGRETPSQDATKARAPTADISTDRVLAATPTTTRPEFGRLDIRA